MARSHFLMSLTAVALAVSFQVQAQSAQAPQRQALVASATDRLAALNGGGAQISMHSATGTARFVRSANGGHLGVTRGPRAVSDDAKQAESSRFFREHGQAFGVTDAANELGAARVSKDRHGGTHITHQQFYKGVPVFGGELKTHFDAANNLKVVNGAFVPDINVNPRPTRTAEQAARAAVAKVQADLGRPARLSAAAPSLMVYRTGLAQGVPGTNHLVWQVEVGNGVDVRDFIFVDAHSGKVVDRLAGIHDAKNRRAYDGQNQTTPGPNYPNNPFWVEGNPFPTGTTEADNMIAASSDIYDLFKNGFGRDSFDGHGATMDMVFNRGDRCPNASWNGRLISFCPGFTTDDVTAHEWGHAYTEYTHNLIYAWQPGALNEAYSDIWGETVDRLNNRGTDLPDNPRTAGACTVFTSQLPTVTIGAPLAIAGLKNAGGASFGPQTFGVTGNVVGVDMGANNAGCNAPFANAAALAGNIAMIDRGTCAFTIKVKNAQNAGAIGVIIGDNVGGNAVAGMSGADATITIPALRISQNNGTAIKAQLAANVPVTARLDRAGTGTDNSVRWLMGEDVTGGGALRDMYNPTCYSNPGKVSDIQYSCGPNTSAGDNGGVHTNSGVPNHAYALLVDGGTYNGQTVNAIGLTKAAHIYYRAQSVYQGPTSNFNDHADALLQSCADLTGANLNHLKTGQPSGEIINATDCAQISNAIAAVEMRLSPAQCAFQPMLAQTPPPLCTAGTPTSLLADTFEGGKRNSVRWLASNQGVFPEFTRRNWGVVTNLPNRRAGYAIFAADADIGNCVPGSGDESGVQRLDSPEVTVPLGSATPMLAFDHWMASEAGFDGGNVKISVNGGAWQLVQPGHFVYNPYNGTLVTNAAGNTNPMAGEPAFTGSDGGSVTGSWGRSIVDLSSYARPGDRVKLRFEMGNDGCGGTFGWYLDNVNLYRCTP